MRLTAWRLGGSLGRRRKVSRTLEAPEETNRQNRKAWQVLAARNPNNASND